MTKLDVILKCSECNDVYEVIVDKEHMDDYKQNLPDCSFVFCNGKMKIIKVIK